MRREETSSYPVSIFIAGDEHKARRLCRDLCDRIGLCVTVTPTTYVYTDGQEDGVIVGLINYPRFPSDPSQIWSAAEVVANALRGELAQESFTIQAPDKTVWFSWRAEDSAQGIEAATAGETPKSGSTAGESPVVADDALVTDLSSPASRED